MENKNCKVTIKSTANGASKITEATGYVTEEDERLKIKYTLEGDDCELAIKGNNAVNTRKGGVTLGLEFEKGKKTRCLVKLGNRFGHFDIFTHDFDFTQDERGIKVDLKYDGADEKPILLTFEAIYLTEKK